MKDKSQPGFEPWWSAAFRFAVMNLGISPAGFWQLSLPELQMLACADLVVLNAFLPTRTGLQSLMEEFPDVKAQPQNADMLEIATKE